MYKNVNDGQVTNLGRLPLLVCGDARSEFNEVFNHVRVMVTRLTEHRVGRVRYLARYAARVLGEIGNGRITSSPSPDHTKALQELYAGRDRDVSALRRFLFAAILVHTDRSWSVQCALDEIVGREDAQLPNGVDELMASILGFIVLCKYRTMTPEEELTVIAVGKRVFDRTFRLPASADLLAIGVIEGFTALQSVDAFAAIADVLDETSANSYRFDNWNGTRLHGLSDATIYACHAASRAVARNKLTHSRAVRTITRLWDLSSTMEESRLHLKSILKGLPRDEAKEK